MAYLFPSVTDFRTKFQEFVDLTDDQINALLNEASRSVDTTWTEGDYKNGILYLAAHLQQSSVDALAVAEGGQISSESIGGVFSVSYATPSSGAFASGLDATIYGARYKNLLKLNIPAMLVV
jgi:hypothetical protein